MKDRGEVDSGFVRGGGIISLPYEPKTLQIYIALNIAKIFTPAVCPGAINQPTL
jgi:hypothetical protein